MQLKNINNNIYVGVVSLQICMKVITIANVVILDISVFLLW